MHLWGAHAHKRESCGCQTIHTPATLLCTRLILNFTIALRAQWITFLSLDFETERDQILGAVDLPPPPPPISSFWRPLEILLHQKKENWRTLTWRCQRYHHNLLLMKRGRNFILRIMLSLSVLLQNLHNCFFLLILLISCYSTIFRGQGQNCRYMGPIFLNRHIKPISAN